MKKILFLFAIAGLFASCGSNTDNSAGNNIPDNLPFNKKILSERIKGPAEVFDDVQNFPVMKLYDYAIVEAMPKENGWSDIGFWIDLKKTPIENNQVYPGTKLVTVEGHEIGEVVAAFYIEPEFENEAFVRSMTKTENIRGNLLPETILSNIINSGKLEKENCSELLDNFTFQHSGTIDAYDEYLIYECSIDDPSPQDRITLMFESGKLASVIHSRGLSVPDFETTDLIRGHKITILKEMNDSEKQSLVQSKIDFYNSID